MLAAPDICHSSTSDMSSREDGCIMRDLLGVAVGEASLERAPELADVRPRRVAGDLLGDRRPMVPGDLLEDARCGVSLRLLVLPGNAPPPRSKPSERSAPAWPTKSKAEAQGPCSTALAWLPASRFSHGSARGCEESPTREERLSDTSEPREPRRERPGPCVCAGDPKSPVSPTPRSSWKKAAWLPACFGEGSPSMVSTSVSEGTVHVLPRERGALLLATTPSSSSSVGTSGAVCVLRSVSERRRLCSTEPLRLLTSR